MKRPVECWVGAVVVLFCTGAAKAETLDSVIKAITDKSESYRSQQARMIREQHFENPQMKASSEANTAYEWLKQGDKFLYRIETKSKTTTSMAGQERTQDATTLTVYDGEYVWTLSEIGEQKRVLKTRPTTEPTLATNKAFFDSLKESYELTLLPDETLDGHATWVIQATPRQPSPQEGMPSVLVLNFDKDTAANLKTVGKDSGGKEVMTISTKDVRLNPPLAADHFAFKVPEGVEVIDMTDNQPAQPQTQPNAAKSEEPKPAEMPKKEPVKPAVPSNP